MSLRISLSVIPFLLMYIVLLLMSPLGCNSVATDNPPLESDREECLNVSNCTSVAATQLTAIDGDGVHSLSLGCPDAAPNIHNIGIEQDRNVDITVVDWLTDSVHVLLRKQDPDQLGRYQIFLGCSPDPFVSGERFGGQYFGPLDLPADDGSEPPESDPPNACNDNIPDCFNMVGARHKAGHLKTHKDDVVCPDHHPWYALAWVHAHQSAWISIHEDPVAKIRFTDRGDAFLVTNWSPTHDHHWQIAIACSAACDYAPGGCPDNHCKNGCHNDPGCKTIVPRKTECAGHSGSCWTTWEEQCSNGEQWFCDTVQFWTCCESC